MLYIKGKMSRYNIRCIKLHSSRRVCSLTVILLWGSERRAGKDCKMERQQHECHYNIVANYVHTSSFMPDGVLLRFLATVWWSEPWSSLSNSSLSFRRRLTRKHTARTMRATSAMVRRQSQASATMLIVLLESSDVECGADGMLKLSPAGPRGPAAPRSPFGPVAPMGPATPVGPVCPVAPCEGDSSGMVDLGQGTQSRVSFTYRLFTVSTYAWTEKW